MAQFTTPDGVIMDDVTGEVIGRTPEAKVTKDPRAKPEEGTDVPFTGTGDMLNGIVNQTTWGLQSALFALPDAATLGIGRALGMQDKDVQTLGKMFKSVQRALGAPEERAPKNTYERYFRAIGEGTGEGLPFTGILAFFARAKPMTQVVRGDASVFKGIADDAIKFVQQNPRTAVALDVAFGSAYEGFRQAVEENVDPDNPNKEFYKEVLPAAALVGGPLALNQLSKVTPLGMAARYGKKKWDAITQGMETVEKGVLSDVKADNIIQKIPGMGLSRAYFLSRAKKKLEGVFGPLKDSPEAQLALRKLEELMADPRVADAGFIFDASERFLYDPMLAEKLLLMEKLPPQQLAEIKARINENQQKLAKLFDSFAPESRAAIKEAFEEAQASRAAAFNRINAEKQELLESEMLALSERLGPQNLDMLNNELRGVILGNMEIHSAAVRDVLESMGLRQAINPDGTLASTRYEGKSLFNSVDMEQDALELINKYQINRPSVSREVPGPIRTLAKFVAGQQATREEAASMAVESLVEQRIRQALNVPGEDAAPGIKDIYEQQVAKLTELAMQLFKKKPSAAAKKALEGMKGEQAKLEKSGFSVDKPSEGEISIPTAVPGRYIRLNVEQIKKDAKLVADEAAKIDINVPEAMDYLQAAIRYRHDALNRYNAALMSGAKSGVDIPGAKADLDTGNAVLRDIENLVLKHVPKVNENFGEMKRLMDGYKNTYERYLPLLLTAQKQGGRENLLPNEDLLRNAFKNAEGIRQLTAVLGPEADSYLRTGAMDWLTRQSIYTKDNLVDPNRIRAVMNRNRNIVEALPQSVRAEMEDTVVSADEVIKRMTALEDRRKALADDKLEAVIKAGLEKDADVRLTLASSLNNPAMMRKLVDAVSGNPEMLGALRRAVYDLAREGSESGIGLDKFLSMNRKSLEVLYKDTKHLDDLYKLNELSRRVNMFAGVTGQLPAFESMDETLKGIFGSGVQYITTTMREAMVGRIRPETGLLALGIRLLSNTEQKIKDRLFLRALEDKTFADRLQKLSTPEDGKKLAAQLQKIGIGPSWFTRNITGPAVARVPVLEAGQELRTEEVPTGISADLPIMTPSAGPTAQEMLRRMPPAPKSRGTEAPSGARLPLRSPGQMPTSAPRSSAAQQLQLMYPALFPNDPISSLLMARQQQITGAQ